MTETRRSPRLIARIPVSLTIGQDLAVQGTTAVVNRHGALVLSPVGCAAGTLVKIRNEITLQATTCRVVWVGQDDQSDIHKLGVEFVDDAPTFWGSVYEERLAQRLEQDDPRGSGTERESATRQ
jgi:hypothetical protein